MSKNILVSGILLLSISACSAPAMKTDGAKMKGTESITVKDIDKMVTYNKNSPLTKMVIDCSKC